MSLSIFSPAPRPANERERQRAVNASGILRAPPDPTLHKLVAETAELLDTPIAGLSIIDRERVWFAARIGMHELETSRAVSFCAHAILNPLEPLTIPDTIEDERFAGNPLVQGEPALRFYVGVPVLGRNSLPLGTLFAVDVKPRLGPLSLGPLKTFAKRAGQAITEINCSIELSD